MASRFRESGTAVVPTCPTHPLALAAQALTVREAAGGRLALGVGVSHQSVVEGQYGYSLNASPHRDETLTAVVGIQVPTSSTPSGVAENLAAVADFPIYRAILEHGGASGPQDPVVLGDEIPAEQQIRRLFDDGANDVVAALLGSREEQPRNAELLTAPTG